MFVFFPSFPYIFLHCFAKCPTSPHLKNGRKSYRLHSFRLKLCCQNVLSSGDWRKEINNATTINPKIKLGSNNTSQTTFALRDTSMLGFLSIRLYELFGYRIL